MKRKIIFAMLVIAIALGGCTAKNVSEKSNSPVKSNEQIKIGVITPLTGSVAFWGESTKLGVELAEKELKSEGMNVEFIIEDGQLDPKVALNAAQKLVNVNKVGAIFSEFNPAAISVTSFLKDKDVLHVYDAAPITPLEETENVYKSYLDYEYSCEKVSKIVKGRGINKVGVLKANLEFGNLCLKGIKNVYGENVYVESYNAGEKEFKTMITKLNSNDIDAMYNIAFQPETLASLKNMKELGVDATFIGLSETVTPDVVKEYDKALEGSIMFGLPTVDKKFLAKLEKEYPGKTISANQAAAIGYMHTKQIAKALSGCAGDMACVRKNMDNLKDDPVIGFTGFTDRIAGFKTLVQEWKNGKFVDIEK